MNHQINRDTKSCRHIGFMPRLKLVAVLTLLLTTVLTARAQQGFVQQDVILKSGNTTDGQVTQLNYTGKQTTRTYVDGMGRPLQTVAVQASPAQNDLIQPAAYDALGRQTMGYLPYAGKSTDIIGSYRPNAISADQPNFYNQTGQHLLATDADPFSQQVFDNSPLQRVLQAGSVGSGFQPGQYYKTVSYGYNASTDAVWIWTSTATHTGGSNYAANTLSVTDGKDEDGVETKVFTDMAGRTILKRQLFSPANLDTYYIYNNSGMLINIIPPKATAIMTANSNYSLVQTGIPALIFSYSYDSRGRVTRKTVPGGVSLNYVYDPLNRPVLVQDANLAANNQWNYIKYDVKGRAISQGIYTDATNNTLALMQSYVNGLSYASAWYEGRSATAINNGYYTNNIFPSTNITPLAYEYFDNYTLGASTYGFHASGMTVDPAATTAQVKGMPTMVQKSTVGSGLSTTWLISVTFYDHNLHPIQTQTNNLLYTGSGPTATTDYKTVLPDFTGAPTVSMVSKKSSPSVTTTVQTTLTYDAAHRITAVDQSYGGTSTVHVAQYTYNELGQLIQKKLGQTATSWLQLVDFRYNIRGQLTNINNSNLTNDSGATDDDPSPVFGMVLMYDQPDSHLSTSPSHSGRLSAVKWMSKGATNNSSYERAFTYTYDAAGRYTAANYAERSSSTVDFTFTHGWDEQITGYDENGNIKTLTRNATTQGSGTYTPVDNLSYTYASTNANQLYTVTDATNNQTGFGIQTGGSAGGHYVYDANGNLTSDPYKDLAISYTPTNKTDKITMLGYTGRYVYYVYDATGTVMEKQQWDGNTLQHTTVYIDGFVYTDGTLTYIITPEGRANYNGGTFTNEYTISDQQGNARVSFNNTGTGGARQVVQENSYYGYGMVMPGTAVTGGDNKLLYNGGSEWQNDYSNMPDYYQTPARNYDAAIGRFISQDPMAESAASMSTYHYAGDNPIMMNDPTGNHAAPVGRTTNLLWAQEVQDPNFQWFASNSDAEMGQWVSSLGASGGGGGAGGFAAGDLGEEEAEFNAFSAYTAAYGNAVMRDQSADYSTFWNTALSVGNAIAQGLGANDNGWHFSGSGFNSLVGLAGTLGADQQINLTAYSDGSSSMSLQFDSSDNVGAAGNGLASGNPGNPGNLFHLTGRKPPYDQNTQRGGTCVFSVTSEGVDYYTGLNLTGLNILGMFAACQSSTDRQFDAIWDQNSNGAFTQQVFPEFLCVQGIQGTDNMIRALESGYPVAAAIFQSAQEAPPIGGWHEVFITGFSYFINGPNLGFNFTFFNSQHNNYQNLPPYRFWNPYAITGSK